MIEQRKLPRQRTYKVARMAFQGGRALNHCLVRDLSDTGGCLAVENPIGIADSFNLVFDSGERSRMCEVVWRNKKQIGIEFRRGDAAMDRDIWDNNADSTFERNRRFSRDLRSGLETRSIEEKFLHGNRRFRPAVVSANSASTASEDAATDRKILRKSADNSLCHGQRSSPDRRSGLETRSIEEKFLQGERRAIGNRRSKNFQYLSFKKARAFARGLGLKSANEWRDYSKSGTRPDDIPVAPHHVYANDGWAGWSDWLGASAIATYFSQYRSFKKARVPARPRPKIRDRMEGLL
jgi:PilZ domain